MNFTREPIIETIISPKEGFKLLVRSSKASGQEEYCVDAVEVVSFGHSFFFRNLERPKCFLVPVSDYEILEVKETRAPLKNAGVERSIKIGGGRDAPVRREPVERPQETSPSEEGESASSQEEMAPTLEQRLEKRRDRRRHRRRRSSQSFQEGGRDSDAPAEQSASPAEGGAAHDETHVSSSIFTTLLPPPPTLISQNISRYKEKSNPPPEGDLPPKPVEKKEEDTGESKELHRTSFSDTSFTPNYSYPSQEDTFFP